MQAVKSFFADPRVKAFLQSLWITGGAIFVLLYTNAQANGQAGSPAALLVYFKANWWGAVSALIIAPSIRSYQAHRGMNGST